MLLYSFHRVIVASLEMKLKLCVAQNINVSRKNISQDFEKLHKRNKINKLCVLESSYKCEEVSNGLIFLPRWQIADDIMCCKGRKRPLSSIVYDCLPNVAAHFHSRELF